jgi:hypothetical protein
MNFAAVAPRRSGRAAPSLRDTPQRQLTSTTGRTSIYRKRNAVQTKPATSAFKMQWTDASSVRMEHVLRDAIYTLLEIGNATLPDILRLLRDKSHRKSVIARISNPLVRDFWRLEFEQYSYRYRADAVAPIPNKVGAGNCSLLCINPVPPASPTGEIRSPCVAGRLGSRVGGRCRTGSRYCGQPCRPGIALRR